MNLNKMGRNVAVAAAVVVSLSSLPSASFAQVTKSAEHQITSKSGLVAGLAAKLKASESQVSALTQKIAAKEAELTKIQSDLKALRDQVSVLQSQGAEKSQQFDEMKAVVKGLETTLQDNQTELVALREKETSLKTLEVQFEAQKSLIDGLNATIQEQEGRLIDLQSKLDATKNDLGSAGGKIGTMEKNLGTYDSTVRDLKADLDQALYQTRERDAEISRLRSDVVEAKSTHSSNLKSLDELELHRIILGGLLALSVIGLMLSLKRRR